MSASPWKHSVSKPYTKDSVDLLVVRRNPSDECKRTECRPDIVREPVDCKGKQSRVPKEAVPAQRPTIGGCPVLGFMEGTEQDRGRQGLRPDQGRGIHEPAPTHASKAEPKLSDRCTGGRVQLGYLPHHLRRQEVEE